MEHWIDHLLDRLQEWSIMAIVWVGVAFWVVIFGIVLINAFQHDPVIGTTEHGIIIRESEIEEKE
jgi:hypothetical protein|tara:strand:- start:554 stop:748 length:195 start_codon:yes stop_codon:yes gene_type:complete